MTAETLESELQRVIHVTPHASSIRGISISVSDDTIWLQGRASTYHQKQMAQHAILGYLNAHKNNGLTGRRFTLKNEVAVYCGENKDG